jgi:hypothetical protein
MTLQRPRGQPIAWDDSDLDALAAVTPTDIKAADALVARDGSPLLKVLYGAAAYIPPVEDTGG